MILLLFGSTLVGLSITYIDGLILYVGGHIGMSYIELDKISLPEIKGHLEDHFKTDNVVKMHWLKPGKELSNGLVLLVDDVSCQLMADGTSYVEIVDIYAEELGVQEMQVQWSTDEECYSTGEEYKVVESDDSSDEEYKQPTDEDSSTNDEEVEQFREFAKEIRRNIKAKKVGLHGSQLGEITKKALAMVEEEEPINFEDPGSPYCDSSDEYSYEENSEGETDRWKSQENSYDSKAPVPVFALGMAFRCSRQFKKAFKRIGPRQRWTGTICPNIFKKLKVNIERSGRCDVLWNGQDGFEVQEREDRTYIVNLDQRSCTCRYWQLSGLPCCHAISCMYKSSRKFDEFIAPCFSILMFNRTYAHVLQPVQGPGNWPISDMPKPEPPAFVKMPGRPKTQRRREAGEEPKGSKLSRVGIKMRCRLCHKSGHNSRRCPKNPEAGNKQNAHIKRQKKRKQSTTPVATITKRQKSTPQMPAENTSTSQARPSQATSNQAQTRGTRGGSQAPTKGRRGRTQDASRGETQAGTSQTGGRLQHLLFGDSY